MAYEEQLKSISVNAGSDLSSRQFRFMVINADGKLAVASTGAKTDGVLQNDPDADGRTGALGIEGVSKVEAGEAITAGDDVAVGSNGKAAVAATGDVVAGRALQDASGDGSIISVLLDKQKEPLS